jgi:hypothetical protein
METTAKEAMNFNIAVPALSITTSGAILLVVLPLAAVLGFFLGRSQFDRIRAKQRELDIAAGETTLGGLTRSLG